MKYAAAEQTAGGAGENRIFSGRRKVLFNTQTQHGNIKAYSASITQKIYVTLFTFT